MLPIIYHLFFDLCGSATKCMTGNSFCEMRRCVYNSTQMLCLMASMDHSLQKMTGGLALILRSSWSRDIFLRALYTSLCVKEISCVKNRLGCRNLRRHSQLQTWWTHIFFFSLFPFLLFSPACLALRQACRPVPMCQQRNYLSSWSQSTCVEQNAWPGNRFAKCADAYIFRRKCRMHCDQTWSLIWKWLRTTKR